MRYNKKGNLILTAHHTTTQAQLNSVADEVKHYIELFSDTSGAPTSHPITARPNVKWSKILINSVPVGCHETRGPYTPEECHSSLVAHNPSYASLTVTQKPSWVHPPSTFTPESTRSSLVVAFEDPDGSARRSLLSSKQLYLLGTRAKVTRWKEKPHTPSNIIQQTESQEAPVEERDHSAPVDPSTEELCSPTPSTSSTITRQSPKPTASPTPATRTRSKQKRTGSTTRKE
jgi:hypothetical protein